jgi:type I restriction enzyme S subunit
MSGLPRGWVEATLHDIFALVRGLTYAKEDVSPDPDESRVALLRANNIQQGKIISDDLIYLPLNIVKEEQIVRAGDVVLATSSGSRSVVGKAAKVTLSEEGLTFGAFCGVLRPQYEGAGVFIFQFMQSRAYREYVEAVAIGTNINNFRSSDIQRMTVPLPPLAEQKRIVAKLDALNAKSARARTELARIETLVSRYKQAVLSKAFSGELTREWRSSNLTAIDVSMELQALADLKLTKRRSAQHRRDLVDKSAIPASWTVVRLEDVCSEIVDGTHHTPTYVDEGVAFVSVKDIRNGLINLAEAKRIPAEEHYQLSRRCNPKGGDVLVTKSGTIGRCAIVPDYALPFSLFVSVALVRPSGPDLSSAFLKYAIEFWVSRIDASSEITGTAIKNLHLQDIKALGLPFTHSQEQHEIVRRIESAFAKIDRLAGEAKRALALVGKLDEAILAKAFRGELVPQDENDEPAHHLLARIRAERKAAPKAKRGRRATA